MGYKMKGPTFFNKKSPMKITSSGNTSMVDAWKAAADSAAEKEITKGENTWKGIGQIAEGVKDVAGKMQTEDYAKKSADRKRARADKLEEKARDTKMDSNRNLKRKQKRYDKAEKLRAKAKDQYATVDERMQEFDQKFGLDLKQFE
jgi:hypothetical protein|tara:strand:- start:93 stop:530 length:438 start_codon:yes stop_codon:yes gene_type:complete